MIFNAPSVIAGFLALVQAGLAAALTIRSVSAARAAAAADSPERRDAAEVAALYPALQAGALLVVVLLSSVVLVEVLSSYVPIWPSVVCIEGVTRIGEGSVGASRHLPALLSGIFSLKPIVLLAGGIWATIHAVSRRATERPGRAGSVVLTGLGGLARVDAALEIAYLGIPKAEQFLSSGCCLVTNLVLVDTPRSWLEVAYPTASENVVGWIAIAAALSLSSTLLLMLRRTPRERLAENTISVFAFTSAAAVSVTAQHVMLAVVSPRLTGVSTHRCLWCVVEFEPLSALAFACALGATGLTVLTLLAGQLEHRRPAAGTDTSRWLARSALLALAASVMLALTT